MFFTREVRPGRSDRTGLFAAWQSRLQVDPRFEPGVEIYYNVEDIGWPGRLADQELLTGPMVHDAYALRHFGLRGAIKYEAGHLFGARRDSPRGRCAGASSTTSHSENPARIYRRLIFSNSSDQGPTESAPIGLSRTRCPQRRCFIAKLNRSFVQPIIQATTT